MYNFFKILWFFPRKSAFLLMLLNFVYLISTLIFYSFYSLIFFLVGVLEWGRCGHEAYCWVVLLCNPVVVYFLLSLLY